MFIMERIRETHQKLKDTVSAADDARKEDIYLDELDSAREIAHEIDHRFQILTLKLRVQPIIRLELLSLSIHLTTLDPPLAECPNRLAFSLRSAKGKIG